MSWSRTLKIRQALRAHIEAGEQIALLFSDLRGFSTFTATRGDEAAFRLSRLHERILRQRIDEHGIVVKSLGDGVMAAFERPIDAFQAAVAILRDARERNRDADQHPMDVGIGIATGTPVMTDIDFIGHSVNLSQRLSSLAKGGQILTSEAATKGVRLPPDLRYVDVGSRSLRGMGMEQIVEVGWLPEISRISDGRDRLTLILTSEGAIVVERAKDRKQSVREAVEELRGARAEEEGLISAILQRAAAGILKRVLQRQATAEGPREFALADCRLVFRRGTLCVRSAHEEIELRSVSRALAERFIRDTRLVVQGRAE